jgi:hypothetical protein
MATRFCRRRARIRLRPLQPLLRPARSRRRRAPCSSERFARALSSPSRDPPLPQTGTLFVQVIRSRSLQPACVLASLARSLARTHGNSVWMSSPRSVCSASACISEQLCVKTILARWIRPHCVHSSSHGASRTDSRTHALHSGRQYLRERKRGVRREGRGSGVA